MPTESEKFFLQTDLTVDEALRLDIKMEEAERALRAAVQIARKARRWDLERFQEKLLKQCLDIRRMTVPIYKSAKTVQSRRIIDQ